MSLSGTKLTLPTITRMSAFGGKADMAEEACRRPLLTQIYRDREDNNAPRMSPSDHINRTAVCRLAARRYQYNPRYPHYFLNAQ